MLLPTSPLRDWSDIDNAFAIMGRGECDSVVSVSSFSKPASSLRYLDENDLMNTIIDVESFEVNRQDISQPLFEVNGSIFIANAEHLKKTKSFHKGRVKAYRMSRDRSVDINTLSDWTIAEAVLKWRK
jgi:CMP-N-acetylneuraminic acid synthetase